MRDKREVFKILEKGSIKRQTAETKMNANSSRSHTVFTVTVFVNQQSIDGQDMLKIGTCPELLLTTVSSRISAKIDDISFLSYVSVFLTFAILGRGRFLCNTLYLQSEF